MKKIICLIMLLTSVMAVCDVNNHCNYNETANLTLNVFNRTNNQPLTGANCTIDIWLPNRTKITDDGNLTEELEGRYYYEISGNEILTLGVYTTQYKCEYESYESYEASDYEIVTFLPQDYLNEINSTVITTNNQVDDIWNWINNATSILYDNILNYLQGQLETTLQDADKTEIAQRTWNETIVEEREISGGAGKWFWNEAERQWEYR